MARIFEISVGSRWGRMYAYYALGNDGKLLLADSSDPDNLAGNDQALKFGGLTLTEAQAKVDGINAETDRSKPDHVSNITADINEVFNVTTIADAWQDE